MIDKQKISCYDILLISTQNLSAAVNTNTTTVQCDSVADPEWQIQQFRQPGMANTTVSPTQNGKNIVDFSHLKMKLPSTASKLASWPSLQYIAAHQTWLVSFCGPVVHTQLDELM